MRNGGRMAKKKDDKKAPKKRKKKVEEIRKIDPSAIPRQDPNLLVDALQALGGEGVLIQRGSEMEGRMDLRRPSGIADLDLACGGGIPSGGLSQIDGPEGVGKNLLLYHYYAQNQKIHGDNSNIFMLCLEFNYDKMFGRACGVQVALSPYEIEAIGRKMYHEGANLTAEDVADLQAQVGNFHVFRGANAEKLLDGVVEAVRLNSYQIGGIDSWDAMLTVADEEKELEDAAKVADASNVQTRWMRKVQSALTPTKICPDCFSRPLGFKRYGKGNFEYICPDDKHCGWRGKKPHPWENETTLIGIRQVRSNLNRRNMRSREYKVGGAWALKHGKLIDIQLRPGEYTKDKKTNEKICKEIVWEITKGKAGTHEGKVGMYKYFYNPPEIDVASNLVALCITRDVVKFEGRKWVVKFDWETDLREEDMVFGSREMFQRAVEDSPEIAAEMRRIAMVKAGLGHVRYR